MIKSNTPVLMYSHAKVNWVNKFTETTDRWTIVASTLLLMGDYLQQWIKLDWIKGYCSRKSVITLFDIHIVYLFDQHKFLLQHKQW